LYEKGVIYLVAIDGLGEFARQASKSSAWSLGIVRYLFEDTKRAKMSNQ
jgi:hypothetical protein